MGSKTLTVTGKWIKFRKCHPHAADLFCAENRACCRFLDSYHINYVTDLLQISTADYTYFNVYRVLNLQICCRVTTDLQQDLQWKMSAVCVVSLTSILWPPWDLKGMVTSLIITIVRIMLVTNSP